MRLIIVHTFNFIQIETAKFENKSALIIHFSIVTGTSPYLNKINKHNTEGCNRDCTRTPAYCLFKKCPLMKHHIKHIKSSVYYANS